MLIVAAFYSLDQGLNLKSRVNTVEFLDAFICSYCLESACHLSPGKAMLCL